MRDLPVIQAFWEGQADPVGEMKPHGRVTVEPGWKLRKILGQTYTAPVGDGEPAFNFGPFRYFQRADNGQTEVEIPNIQSIEIDRSLDQDAATCSITMYSTGRHNNTTEEGIGIAGWYHPKYGRHADAQSRWGISGTNEFFNLMWMNALIRTYQGYGGWELNSFGELIPKDIDVAVADGNIALTGVWLVDTISSGTDGMITLECRDMAKLLVDQMLYPPIIPRKMYPLRMCRYYYEYPQEPHGAKPYTSDMYDGDDEDVPDTGAEIWPGDPGGGGGPGGEIEPQVGSGRSSIPYPGGITPGGSASGDQVFDSNEDWDGSGGGESPEGTWTPEGTTPDHSDLIEYEGNIRDWTDAVITLLLWSGFTLYDGQDTVDNAILHAGIVEFTGTYPKECLTEDMFDKRPVIDAINEIKEALGYVFFLNEDGSVRWHLPNFWSDGNNYEKGGRTDYVHEVDENRVLIDYTQEVSDANLRSMIIIGSTIPTEDRTRTKYVKWRPHGAWALKRLRKPAIWINEAFTDTAEQIVMAGLLGLNMWHNTRLGQVTCLANPAIQLDDQIRIWERTTSDTYVHYVRGIQSSMDLDSGEYVMTIDTNFMGLKDDWFVDVLSFLTSWRLKNSGRLDLQAAAANLPDQYDYTPPVG